MKLRIGYSPCPNDTFIFDALIHEKIDTEGLHFEPHLADVEELNKMAFNQVLDITKLSYHAYAYVLRDYILLQAGSALGNNCGPLLVAREPIAAQAIPDLRVAIPGKYTTANFLLHWAFPALKQREALLFSEIEDAVVKGDFDAGLIIHENRFTYQEKGLVQLVDLGARWEQQTGLPIPLGGIVTRRSLESELQQRINRVLRRSVQYALNNPADSMDYVRAHAQAMEPQVMRQHIELYVNNYSVDLGEQGRAAIEELFQTAAQQARIPQYQQALWIEPDDFSPAES